MSHTRLIWLLTLLLLAGSVLGVAWLSGAPFALGGTPPSTLPPPSPPAARPAPQPRATPHATHARVHVPRAAPAPAAAASVIEAPAVAAMHAPRYPIAALRGRHEGVAVVRVEVGADGEVAAAVLAQSSGWPELDRAALEAVRRWHFRAARRDGRAVEGALDVPVRFRIDAGGG
ncbi:TonB family protein [Mizugakiibacter sediminis]|uniref:TonB family protein n=1 Tax=Mizugakiibacter sediminis TaxID=1475481 RepID=A0A0K8QLX3_9GAMM|nr:energy transducer TonB [Mizugakiibacter sediminis]GAP65691.1 TonB family protein [Mizugakiibacter sediminis]